MHRVCILTSAMEMHVNETWDATVLVKLACLIAFKHTSLAQLGTRICLKIPRPNDIIESINFSCTAQVDHLLSGGLDLANLASRVRAVAKADSLSTDFTPERVVGISMRDSSSAPFISF